VTSALPTDADVIAAFQDYITERANNGVIVAKAVTNITFTNRIVTVTFDPSKVKLSLADFKSINPFDNLAEFAGIPISFADDEGARLRPAIDVVATVLPDGTSLGSMTTAQLYEAGTGEPLPSS